MLETNDDESIQIGIPFDDNSSNTDSTSPSKIGNDAKIEEEEISFSSKSQNYCVCFVSMVDSIEITFEIKDSEKIRRYYSIFINTMAAIARNFSAKIIKNTGTSLYTIFQKRHHHHHYH